MSIQTPNNPIDEIINKAASNLAPWNYYQDKEAEAAELIRAAVKDILKESGILKALKDSTSLLSEVRTVDDFDVACRAQADENETILDGLKEFL